MRFYFLSSILSLALCSSVHSQSSDYNFFFSDGFGVIGGNAQIDVMLSIASGVEEISGWSLGVCHSSFFQNFTDFLSFWKFSAMFGHVRTCWGAFGCVFTVEMLRVRMDASGRVWTLNVFQIFSF